MMMDFLTNEIFVSTALALIIAHIWKLFHSFVENKKFDFKSLYATGGMPSSHTSIVTALTTSVGFVEGFSSTFFIISLFFTGIIIRDALGVRRTVDDLIKHVNKIIQNKDFGLKQIIKIAGHTPVQVLAGFLLGLSISIGIHILWWV